MQALLLAQDEVEVEAPVLGAPQLGEEDVATVHRREDLGPRPGVQHGLQGGLGRQAGVQLDGEAIARPPGAGVEVQLAQAGAAAGEPGAGGDRRVDLGLRGGEPGSEGGRAGRAAQGEGVAGLERVGGERVGKGMAHGGLPGFTPAWHGFAVLVLRYALPMRPDEIHIISDLHLGGRPPNPPGDPRGFRMCSQGRRLATFVSALADRDRPVELVIAGDFVDFLAEPDEAGRWSPFHHADAALVLRRVIEQREPAVFAALARLLDRGHRLVVLLGNHDVELALPDCRALLRRALGAGPGRRVDLELVLDDEAYVVGDAIIEHGNRVDPMNVVDHDALRAARVQASLRRGAIDPRLFSASPGSRLVAEQMNPLKAELPFIDLLKPETRAVPPVLLALKPSALGRLLPTLRFLAEGKTRQAVDEARAVVFGREIAAGAPQGSAEALDAAFADLPPELAAELMEEVGASRGPTRGREINATRGAGEAPGRNVDLLRRVLLHLTRADGTFDLTEEQGAAYREAAEAHARAGYRVVVMGHTHSAVHEPIVASSADPRAVYLNTGTWADLMTLPEGVADADPQRGNAALATWLEGVREARFDVLTRPTWACVRLDGEERVERAELRQYRNDAPEHPDNLLAG